MTQIDPDELHALADRIINSGVLGRSKTYGAILNYLVDCSIEGKTPKEAAIAVDVLGREADFDVAKESIVRVQIYHLRSKLSQYFDRQGKREKYRLEIPKGQYLITTSINEVAEEPTQIPFNPLDRNSRILWVVGLVIILLLTGILFEQTQPPVQPAEPLSPLQGMSPWQAFLDDDLPILLVIGDYYIFGETDESGNVARMVREFNINSRDDLAGFRDKYPARGKHYYNLDMSYIPDSIANAMARVMPILGDKADQISVKMMSKLETSDLADNHIIYLGFLSGVNTLLDLMFADSGLSIGVTYDELINLDTNEYYVGSSGLSGEEGFQDYGMISSFPAPNGNHILLVAGMRDEGLINVSRQVTSPGALEELADSFGGQNPESFEALYEVFGFDYTNFGGKLVYTRELDTQVIWQTRLINQ